MVFSCVLAVAVLGGVSSAAGVGEGDAVAVISLFNPTNWSGPLTVEVPTGRIATPGLLDWRGVRLQVGTRVVPFALRSGRAHWQTNSAAPVATPRAEDLLVFSIAAAPNQWVSVRVLRGSASSSGDTTHLVRKDGRARLVYDEVTAVIDEATGTLWEFSFRGESLLTGPMGIEVTRLSASAPYELVGSLNPGYAYSGEPSAPTIKVNRGERIPHRVRWGSATSTDAMTEINLLIETTGGPSMALTYRLHSHGMLDIVADSQPWTGTSPWCDHAAAYTLPLAGRAESLPCLENRYPFYGFKGYTASVRQAAAVRRGTRIGAIELGEETVNGRRWVRRVIPIDLTGPADPNDLVEAADEGLVIDVLPMRNDLPTGGEATIACPDSAQAVGTLLSQGLEKAGLKVRRVGRDDASVLLRLEIVTAPEDGGIEPDGFEIRPIARAGWSARARSVNGLYQAATAVVAHLSRHGAGLPLIAGNPVVPLRAGGFGGGNFEVDFPYGSEEEWRRTFENLVVSGMNRFGCLGMWGNWKMPVSYAYMPEIRSSSREAYDESSGAKFVEIDEHRQRGLRLARFLHDRGAGVWLWIPIGCVPTTFTQKFPTAMAPRPEGGHSDKIPCFTHPDYRRYVEAFFRELLETYPIEGLVLIRDDNGGLCTCPRCKSYTAGSRTKEPAWEQYLVIYDMLRAKGFGGDIAVYPYFDTYMPRLEPLLPKDLYVVGHGGEPAVLTRDYARTGLMGDTWLDNLYANFRLPPCPRMKRLLADRGSFWIGGAYCGTELPWESVGRFGWEPTATANTLRYEWGQRTFGHDRAIGFVRMSQTYERLWEINARYLLPGVWMKLDPNQRQDILAEGTAQATTLRTRLAELKRQVDPAAHARWFGHVELFAPFIEYHLHRLDLFARVYDLVVTYESTLKAGKPLPDDVRRTLLGWYREMYEWAAKYDRVMKGSPDGMLTHCRGMTKPYKEWMAGYDQWLEPQLKVRQFAGTVKPAAGTLKAGQPFALTIELHNLGACPWVAEAGQLLQLSGAAEALGLPKVWTYEGEGMAPGDRRTITLKGKAPASPGRGKLKAAFLAPFSFACEIAACEIDLKWE